VPELPEVEALARFLDEKAKGVEVAAVEVLSIAVLKTFDPPADALAGHAVAGVWRRGKFLVLDVGPLHLVLHLARAGWVRWHDELKAPAGARRPGKSPIALRVRLAPGSGFEVTEMGHEKRLAAWVVRSPEDVPDLATLGIDPLDAAFDAGALGRLLSDQRGQIKRVLTDQRLIAGVGNAYSDEALHAARLSPFKSAANLTPPEVERLHDVLVEVLRDAVARSAGLPAAGLKKEKKEGLQVHGRTGQPCPVCGDLVRQVAFSGKSLQYCPTCQTGGKPLADRRFSKLLK
jgi:formamidopyrimidine-DNA glycosylase